MAGAVPGVVQGAVGALRSMGQGHAGECRVASALLGQCARAQAGAGEAAVGVGAAQLLAAAQQQWQPGWGKRVSCARAAQAAQSALQQLGGV